MGEVPRASRGVYDALQLRVSCFWDKAMATRFYNTLAHEMREFVPLEAGKDPANPLEGAVVKMYTCGPTVYDYAHIGNFRAFLFADLLRRYLEFRGATVKQVMNMTDVG